MKKEMCRSQGVNSKHYSSLVHSSVHSVIQQTFIEHQEKWLRYGSYNQYSNLKADILANDYMQERYRQKSVQGYKGGNGPGASMTFGRASWVLCLIIRYYLAEELSMLKRRNKVKGRKKSFSSPTLNFVLSL